MPVGQSGALRFSQPTNRRHRRQESAYRAPKKGKTVKIEVRKVEDITATRCIAGPDGCES